MEDFATAVSQRFNNPYIDHSLLAITLNSTSKWRARVLPTLLDYHRQTGALPTGLTFSFAAYLSFYHRGQVRSATGLLGKRGVDTYEIQDDAWVLDFFYDHREDDWDTLVPAVLGNHPMWGTDFTQLPGFQEAVLSMLRKIDQLGMSQAMEALL